MRHMLAAGNRINTDVLVIGGGIAGICASLEAVKNGQNVILASKGSIGRSGNTPMAEGGIQATFHVGDSIENHFKDTLDAGRYINDPVLVQTLVEQAPGCIKSLEDYGVKFKKQQDGGYSQFMTSGSSNPRCLWISGGGPGLIKPVYKKAAAMGVKMLEDVMITSLLKSGGTVVGARGMDFKTGEMLTIGAKSVVIAAGGNESLYYISDASPDSTGDGTALAYNAGAELVDMEFIQFYPHSLTFPQSLKGVLIPEEVYYKNLAGGRLVNGLKEEFAHKYDPERRENTTRDILARAIFTEISEGRGTEHEGVIIDLTKGSRQAVMEYLPSLYNYLFMNGVDMLSTELEVAPSAHYQCGGIKIDAKGQTTVSGLFAAGECTGGIDGANRLSSNALTEAVVFGMITGKNAAKYASQIKGIYIDEKQVLEEQSRINEAAARDVEAGMDVLEVKEEVQRLMSEYVGVVRSGQGLEYALDRLQKIKNEELSRICIKNREAVYNMEIMDLLELSFLVDNALIVAVAANYRKESRGSHFRTDYPLEDDMKWKKSIAVKKDGH